MSINFHIGQRVVCIHGADSSSATTNGWAPKTGGIYTIRGIYDGPIRVDLNLEEYVHHAFHEDGSEIGWDSTRFRPVVERKTDISIFKAMLTPSKVREPA